jgi:hypothetical protein
MTRLSHEIGFGGDRQDVLGVHPEAAGLLEEVLAVACGLVDAPLLELAWRQLVEQLGCVGSSPGAAGGHAADGAVSGELETAVRAYVEQFALDPNGITEEQNDELARHLSQSGLFDFVSALNVLDGYLRTCALLGVDPGPPRRTGAPRATASRELPARPAVADGPAMRAYRLKVIAPELLAARTAFSKAAMRLDGVDDVTTEAARLRNASFQQCHY